MEWAGWCSFLHRPGGRTGFEENCEIQNGVVQCLLLYTLSKFAVYSCSRVKMRAQNLGRLGLRRGVSAVHSATMNNSNDNAICSHRRSRASPEMRRGRWVYIYSHQSCFLPWHMRLAWPVTSAWRLSTRASLEECGSNGGSARSHRPRAIEDSAVFRLFLATTESQSEESSSVSPSKIREVSPCALSRPVLHCFAKLG